MVTLAQKTQTTSFLAHQENAADLHTATVCRFSPDSQLNSQTLDSQSDEQLISAYALHAQRDAFAVLMKRYEREMLAFLNRYFWSNDQKEEAFYAIFLKVHLYCQRFDTSRSFRAWLYQIARNQAYDLMRDRQRVKDLGAISLDAVTANRDNSYAETVPERYDNGSPILQLIEAERRQTVLLALAQLPDKYREVLQLVYFQELSYEQAAAKIGIGYKAARGRTSRAISALTEILQQSTAFATETESATKKSA